MESENKQPVDLLKSKKGIAQKNIALIAVALIVIAGIGYASYKLGTRNSRTIEVVREIVTDAEDTASDPDTTPEPAAIPDNVVYTPEVGKFTLTLPNKYVIVQQHDGGAEGGPVTHIEIAEATDSHGLVRSSDYAKVTMTAHPITSEASFRSQVDGEMNEVGAERQASVNIDGVGAEVYTYSGLFLSKNIYIYNNGMYYRISLTDTTDEANVKLADIITGLKLN